jgi:hypothetical protein
MRSTYHLDVLTGANDVQGPFGHPVPPDRAAVGGRGVATAVLVIAVAGLIVAAIGLTIRLLPRHFTSAQRQRITAWEVAGRWRDLSAGQIFPATIGYAPPKALSDTGSSVALTARRVGIAPQAPCGSSGGSHPAVDPAAAAVLAGNGCEAVLRATYTDGTGSYVATVGVAPFPSPARADAAEEALGAKRLRMSGGRAPSVLALPFAGTLTASFDDSRRQVTRNIVVGPYLVMYAIGYTDGRPLVPVSADSYADAEMTSFGAGVAKSAADTLGAQPPALHCPGTPGC